MVSFIYEVIYLFVYFFLFNRKEHESHSGKCPFLQISEDDMTVRQFLELIRDRMIFRVVSNLDR